MAFDKKEIEQLKDLLQQERRHTRSIVNEAIEQLVMPQFDRLDTRLDKVENRLEKIEDDMSSFRYHLERIDQEIEQIKGEITDMQDMLSEDISAGYKEVDILKERVLELEKQVHKLQKIGK